MRFEVGEPEGGGARSTAVTSGNYGTSESLYACTCMCVCASERARARARMRSSTLARLESCTPDTGWVQEIPCNSNSLNSYPVRLYFSGASPFSSSSFYLCMSPPSFASAASRFETKKQKGKGRTRKRERDGDK